MAQADTIIPTGVQGLDRYAYANNSPLNFVDPSGHIPCDEDSNNCSKADINNYQKQFYTDLIKDKYHWKVKGDWSLDDLKIIYQTGHDIEAYINVITNGKGLAWMNKYLDNVTIGHWNINRPMTLPGFGGNSIINFTANQQLNSGWLAHELGHVWDMNTSSGLPYVGGAADALNTFIDGQGDTIFNNRVINNADHNPTKYIPVTTTINGYVYNNHFNKNIFFMAIMGITLRQII